MPPVRYVNFCDLWEPKDLARLLIEVVSPIKIVLANSQRGRNYKGWCNCRQCSAKKPRRPIPPYKFHEHMLLEARIRREEEEDEREEEEAALRARKRADDLSKAGNEDGDNGDKDLGGDVPMGESKPASSQKGGGPDEFNDSESDKTNVDESDPPPEPPTAHLDAAERAPGAGLLGTTDLPRSTPLPPPSFTSPSPHLDPAPQSLGQSASPSVLDDNADLPATPVVGI